MHVIKHCKTRTHWKLKNSKTENSKQETENSKLKTVDCLFTGKGKHNNFFVFMYMGF